MKGELATTIFPRRLISEGLADPALRLPPRVLSLPPFSGGIRREVSEFTA